DALSKPGNKAFLILRVAVLCHARFLLASLQGSRGDLRWLYLVFFTAVLLILTGLYHYIILLPPDKSSRAAGRLLRPQDEKSMAHVASFTLPSFTAPVPGISSAPDTRSGRRRERILAISLWIAVDSRGL